MHKQTTVIVTRKLYGTFPSGLSRYDGLADKGKWVRTENGGKDKISYYTVDNSINWNANPLHMNAHSFGNNCNQYIYIFTPSVSLWSLLESSVLLLVSQFIIVSLSASLKIESNSWLECVLQSTIQKWSHRIDVSAVVGLHIPDWHIF